MNEVLKALLEELNIRDLSAYFQPIIHLHTARVLGYEALLRPAGYDGTMLAPGILFEQADLYGCLPELEREARTTALREFARSRKEQTAGQLLFLNVSAPLLNVGVLDAGHIREAVQSYEVEPEAVAIEISESSVQETDQLVEFSRMARKSGFMISLDGYGTDESHLERIARIRPEIIKIDRSIIQGVCTDEIKQYALESVVHLARRVGAVSLAFGIENHEDLVACARAGVEFGQGFLLGRPAPTVDRAIERAEKTLKPLQEKLASTLASDLDRELQHEASLQREFGRVLDKLARAEPEEWEAILRAWKGPAARVDSLFITSPAGEQLTNTIALGRGGKAIVNPLLYAATGPGDDHGSREYVYALRLRGDGDLHLSSPHTSIATGQLCRTYSQKITGPEGARGILCVSATLSSDVCQ